MEVESFVRPLQSFCFLVEPRPIPLLLRKPFLYLGDAGTNLGVSFVKSGR